MYLKAICFTAAALIFMTSSVEAQSFGQLGTRRGALVGGVIGGIIGGQNDEVAAGIIAGGLVGGVTGRCLLYTSPSPRDQRGSRMPSSA